MPLRDALDAAIADPTALAPVIRHLGGGSLAATADGKVWRLHGRDAIVARLDQASGRSITLRFPVTPDGDPAAIAVHAAFATSPVIARLRAGAPSPICGGVSVIASGLTLRDGRRPNAPHPVIAMEWIPGPTLADAALSLAERGDRERLAVLATQWTRAMLALADAGFTHGELDPGNALLRRGDAIVLVDYDTAAWPDSPAGRFPLPDPAYTHPGGVPTDLARRDDLPALIVLLTLRALAAEPRLLTMRDDRDPDTGLLLTPRDLAMPCDSRRFHRMAASPDPEVAALAGIVADALRHATNAAPPFAEAIRAVRAALRRDRAASAPPLEPAIVAPPLPPAPSAPKRAVQQEPGSPTAAPAPPPGPPRKIDARTRQAWLTRLNSLLLEGNDAEAVRFWRQSGLAEDEAARKVAGKWIDAAIERITPRGATPAAVIVPEPAPPPVPPTRPGWGAVSSGGTVARLEAALSSGDIDTIESLWPKVAPTPDGSRLAAPVHETLRQLYLGALYREAREGDLASLRRVAENAVRAGVPIPADLRAPLRLAVQQDELIARLESAIAAGDSEQVAAIAWSDPEAILGDLTPEARSLLAGARRLPSLIKAIATDNDQAILAAAGPEGERGELSLPQPIWQRLDLARDRIAWLDAIHDALRARDDIAIDELLRTMPAGADRHIGPGLQKRIARWRAGRLAQASLVTAIAQGDERGFIAALDHLEQAGALLPPTLDRAGFAAMMARVGRAMDARDLFASGEASVGDLAASLPAMIEDAASDPRGLAASLPLDEQRRAVQRGAHVARLRDALATAERSRIRAAARPDPHDAVAALAPAEQAQVAAALADHPLSAPALRYDDDTRDAPDGDATPTHAEDAPSSDDLWGGLPDDSPWGGISDDGAADEQGHTDPDSGAVDADAGMPFVDAAADAHHDAGRVDSDRTDSATD